MRTTNLFLVMALALIAILPAPAAAAAAPDTLVLVNDEAITTADLDEEIVAAHSSDPDAAMTDALMHRLLEKKINDRLLIQQAEALGFGDDPAIREPLAEKLATSAARSWARAHFEPEISVTDRRVREEFERLYWKIQLRQVSVRTEQRADSLRAAIIDGAPMAEVAAEHSLDTHRYRQGAHPLKSWADVENVIRDAVRDLEVGEISEPFPFRDAYAIVRVEERQDIDEDAFDVYEEEIRTGMEAAQRNAAWLRFLDELQARNPITTDDGIMAAIDADSSVIFKGEFLEGSDRPVLSIGDHRRDERQVRKAISHAAMQDGTAPYSKVRRRGLDQEREKLLVHHAAAAAGYLDDPDVLEAHRRRREQALIEAYLQDFVASKIVFDRDEFQAFYEENQDAFRGPDQVKLATLVLRDREAAAEAAGRLQTGADFDFIAEQYADDPHVSVSQGDWASISVFSDDIREQAEGMEVGGVSTPVEMSRGWLVFRLSGRRPGVVPPIEAVDMQIRQVMYQRTFSELLDEHLGLLKERSDITRLDDAIAAYFSPGS